MRIYFFEHGFYQVADRDHARGGKGKAEGCARATGRRGGGDDCTSRVTEHISKSRWSRTGRVTLQRGTGACWGCDLSVVPGGPVCTVRSYVFTLSLAA